jgi:hypothetical protein
MDRGRRHQTEYCEFKDCHICYADDDEKELADLIRQDLDTTKVVANSRN